MSKPKIIEAEGSVTILPEFPLPNKIEQPEPTRGTDMKKRLWDAYHESSDWFVKLNILKCLDTSNPRT